MGLVVQKKLGDGMARERGLLLLLVFFFALMLAVSGRAYHVDDSLYVQLARQAQLSPQDPYAGVYATRQNSAESGFSVMLHPPLLVYFLAGVKSVLGEGERTYHLCYSLFSLMALSAFCLRLSAWLLSRRPALLRGPSSCLGAIRGLANFSAKLRFTDDGRASTGAHAGCPLPLYQRHRK